MMTDQDDGARLEVLIERCRQAWIAAPDRLSKETAFLVLTDLRFRLAALKHRASGSVQTSPTRSDKFG